MGKATIKKVKNRRPVCKPSINHNPEMKKTRRKRQSKNFRKKAHLEHNCNVGESSTSFNSSVEVIKSQKNSNSVEILEDITNNEIINITDTTIHDDEDENNQPVTSKVIALNIDNDDIIDITETTLDSYEYLNSQPIPSKVITTNISNDDIIDITDTTIYENKNIETSSNNISTCCDDVQFISYTASNTTTSPIELITLSDDSNDENTKYQQSIEKQISFKSITENVSIPVHPSNKRKITYNSPLRHHKRTKGDDIFTQHFPSENFGSFIIDKNRISRSQMQKNVVHQAAQLPQKKQPSSNTNIISNRKLRPIIIDGLNIGHAHGGPGIFSGKGIDLCIQFFANRGHKDIIAFIPQHRQGPPGSESNTILNKLVKKGHICFTPSRKVQNLRMTCYDDRIILDYAHRCGGVVVSNDNYRDLYQESDAFKEIIENRQVMVTFVRDEIIVPDDQYNRRSDVRSLSDILCYPA